MFLKSILFIVLSLMFCDGNNVYYEADCFQEQSCFAGYYNQNHTYEGSEDSYVLSLPNDYDGYIRFDMDHKEIDSINGTSSESLLLSDLYAPRYDGYEFASFENTNYPEFDGENSNELFGMNWGPKDPYVNSVCKIRAYYHNVAFNNGLVTVMYDFTGFLVGDSLLMTTAHGLCLDVTCGLFDDGVEDLYFPGKIEVYGAIGLADVWGNSYGYYSLATEIFMNSDYVRNRITQNDWALLRLDRPLGRELSYKVIKSWDLPTSPMKLIGYPMFNQFHQRLNADNVFVTDGGEVCRYFADTLDGMSGSPLYNTDLRAINNFNIYEHPFAEKRVAYGMHVKKNVNTGECLAIKFTDEHKTIVRALNKKCEPDTVRLLPARNNYLSYVNGRTISVGQEILCEVSASNVYEGSGAFRFCSADSSERLAYLDFEFNMPISTIRFSFSIIGASNGAELFCSAKDYFDHNEQFNIVENGIKTNNFYNKTISFPDPVKRISLSFVRRIQSSSFITTNILEFVPDWSYIPVSAYAPTFDEHEIGPDISKNNCVSYALKTNEGVSVSSQHPFVPGRLSGVTMDRLRDTTPETIIRLIRNDCEILERAFGKATKYSPAPLFCYKIAIFIDPHFYYHVFRENQNGYWSHFVPGTAGPTQLDSNGQLIRDPEKCVFVNEWDSYSTPDANGSHIKILEGNNCLSMLDVFDLTSFVGYFYTDMVF